MKKEDILTNCIDDILEGNCTLEDCLARYPYLSAELRELLNIATLIPPEDAAPTSAFLQRGRDHLIEAMEPQIEDKEKIRGGVFGWVKPLIPARGLGLPLLVAILIFVLIAAGGGTVYASQSSLPDDTLYPIKRGVENLQLVVTLSPEAKASLHLKLAQRRVEEVIAQSSLGRNISTSALEDIALQIDEAIRQIDSLLPEDTKTLLSQLSDSTTSQQAKLNQLFASSPEATKPALERAINATSRGHLIANVAYGNPAILGTFPSVLDERLGSGYFELKGVLLSVENDIWNVGGLILRNVNYTRGVPSVGSTVKIEGLVRNGEIFVSEIERDEEPETTVKIQGVFGGSSSDGEIWYVSGIPFSAPQNATSPLEGSQIKIEGVIQNGVFTVIDLESEEKEEGQVEIEGVLIQVNHDEKTILVELAGTQVTINVSEALITDEDGRLVAFSDLESLLGEEIEVEGIYLKDDALYATDIRVDVEREGEGDTKVADEEDEREYSEEEK